MSPQSARPDFTGWQLDEVRAQWQGSLRVVETTPPIRPGKPHPHPPHWGEWRVLRCRYLEEGALELLVAREQLPEPS